MSLQRLSSLIRGENIYYGDLEGSRFDGAQSATLDNATD